MTSENNITTSVDDENFSIAGSVKKQKIDTQKLNPLYGYRIKAFVAQQPGTQILRIRHQVFMQFLERSVVQNWNEVEQISNFPQEIRLEHLTKKQRDQFFKNFVFRKFEKNEVLLKVGQMPQKVLLVVQGQVKIFSHHPLNGDNLNRAKNAVAVRVYPASRIQTQIQKGDEFGNPIIDQEITDENTEFIGIECDLLGIKSPYSYIASKVVYAYEIPYESFFQRLVDLNPHGLVQLTLKAQEKMKRLQALCRGREIHKTACEKLLETVKCDPEKEEKLVQEVQSQFPHANKNISYTLQRMITQKQQNGQSEQGKFEKIALKGKIDLIDMIKLEKLKKMVFWDYDRADKIIENLRDERMGRKPRNDIKIKKIDKLEVRADEKCKPLSYSGIVKNKKRIRYVDDPIRNKEALQLFTQEYDNPFYEPIRKEKAKKQISNFTSREANLLPLESERFAAKLAAIDLFQMTPTYFRKFKEEEQKFVSQKTAATLTIQKRSNTQVNPQKIAKQINNSINCKENANHIKNSLEISTFQNLSVNSRLPAKLQRNRDGLSPLIITQGTPDESELSKFVSLCLTDNGPSTAQTSTRNDARNLNLTFSNFLRRETAESQPIQQRDQKRASRHRFLMLAKELQHEKITVQSKNSSVSNQFTFNAKSIGQKHQAFIK